MPHVEWSTTLFQEITQWKRRDSRPGTPYAKQHLQSYLNSQRKNGMSHDNAISKHTSKSIFNSLPSLFSSSPLYSLWAFPCLGPPLNCVVHVEIIFHVWLHCVSRSSIMSRCNVHPLHHVCINCTTSPSSHHKFSMILCLIPSKILVDCINLHDLSH